MSFVVTDLPEHTVGIFDHRGAFSFMDRRNLLYHIRNLIGVGNDDFFCLFSSQISKFLQHFLCSPQIQRRLLVCIVKAFSCHNDPPVYLVLRIQEVNVTGSYHRLIKGLSQLHDLPVDLLKIFLSLDIIPVRIPEHKGIVADRLDLQIIIEVYDPGDLCIRPAV